MRSVGPSRSKWRAAQCHRGRQHPSRQPENGFSGARGTYLDVTTLGQLGLESLIASDGVDVGPVSPMLWPIAPMSSMPGPPNEADNGLGLRAARQRIPTVTRSRHHRPWARGGSGFRLRAGRRPIHRPPGNSPGRDVSGCVYRQRPASASSGVVKARRTRSADSGQREFTNYVPARQKGTRASLSRSRYRGCHEGP